MRQLLAERFWDKVDKQAPSVCWPWKGAKNLQGYGRIRENGEVVGAHRVAYELTNGPIPAGLDICHHCDNPICVNLDHLFCGTTSDNLIDCVKKGRMNHSGENNSNSKLSLTEVKEIKAFSQLTSRRKPGYISQAKLAHRFGISASTIRDILKGRSWNYI